MPRPPSRGGVTESYGWRTWTTPPRMHWGEDTDGDGNYAPVTGTVIFAGWYGGLGYLVVIRERANPSVLWLIGHHADLSVSTGQTVTEGKTFLGPIGTTGDSTGIHAHTERRVVGSAGNPQGGTATNPREYYTSAAGGGTTPFPEDETEEDTVARRFVIANNSTTNPAVVTDSGWLYTDEFHPIEKIADGVKGSTRWSWHEIIGTPIVTPNPGGDTFDQYMKAHNDRVAKLPTGTPGTPGQFPSDYAREATVQAVGEAVANLPTPPTTFKAV